MVKVLGYECGTQGYGLMGYHLSQPPKTPEEAIPVMKQALESGNTFWSAAEFYGTPENNSLHLLHAYFSKYPEDASRVCLSLKIGFQPQTMALKTSPDDLRTSMAECERVLAGTKKIDILSVGRVDPNIPIETSVATMYEFVKEGRIGAVGMSECSAATLRRAAQVCPIAAVEVEFSISTPELLTNGVAQAAGELSAVVAAYSPLGRGLLTGAITAESLPENDRRRHWPRFQEEALANNLKLVKEMDSIAERHGATKGQIALAWAKAYSGAGGFGSILPIPGTTNAKRLEENNKVVKLTQADMEELNRIIKDNPVVGGRYPEQFAHLEWA